MPFNAKGQPATEVPSVNMPRVLVTFWRLTLVLFGIAGIVVYIRGYIFHEPFPFNTFLFNSAERFSDFSLYAPRLEHLRAPQFFARTGFRDAYIPLNYPPLTAFVLWTVVNIIGGLPFLMLLIAAGLSLCQGLYRSLVKRGVSRQVATAFALSTALTSYPLLFLLDRLNVEGTVWIILSLGLIAFSRNRSFVAAILIGFAAAMKIFPGIFLVLFVSRRQWKELAAALSSVAILTATAFVAMGPDYSATWHGISGGMKFMNTFYLYLDRGIETGYQHSFWSVIKQVMCAVGVGQVDKVGPANFAYQLTGAAFGLWLYFKKLRPLPILNQMIAISACAIALPWWSGDYTLVHLYVPWGLLVLWIVDREKDGLPLNSSDMLWFLVPYAILFTPQTYLTTSSRMWAGQVKAIALAALIYASVRFPLRDLSSRPEASEAIASPVKGPSLV